VISLEIIAPILVHPGPRVGVPQEGGMLRPFRAESLP